MTTLSGMRRGTHTRKRERANAPVVPATTTIRSQEIFIYPFSSFLPPLLPFSVFFYYVEFGTSRFSFPFFRLFLFFCLLKFSEKKRSYFSFRSSLSSFLFSLIDSFYLARFSVCPVVEISKQVENWNAEHVLISDRTRCNFEKIDDLIVRNNRLISWREIWRNLKNLSIPQQASMYYIVGYQLKIKKWRTRYINIKNIEKIFLIWICTEEKKIIFPLRHR